MMLGFSSNLGGIKLSHTQKSPKRSKSIMPANISMEVDSEHEDEAKLVIASKPFHPNNINKMLLAFLLMVLVMPILRKPEFIRFTRWDLLLAFGMMIFLSLWKLYEVINAFVESQTLLIKENHLIIQKDRLFNSVEYFIPLEGIYSIKPESYYFKAGYVFHPHLSTIKIGQYSIHFGEHVSFSESYWICEQLNRIVSKY